MKDIAYTSVQVEVCLDSGTCTSVRFGTAFILEYQSNTSCYTLVSNRHVIGSFDKITIRAFGLEYTLHSETYSVLCHQDPEIDLAVICINRMESEAPLLFSRLKDIAVKESQILNKPDISELTTTTRVTSPSVPNHLISGKTPLPIVRYGIIASPPELTAGELILDIACFASYSGSPVFLAGTSPDTFMLAAVEKRGISLAQGQYVHMSISQCAYFLLDFKPFLINNL